MNTYNDSFFFRIFCQRLDALKDLLANLRLVEFIADLLSIKKDQVINVSRYELLIDVMKNISITK